MFYDAWDSFEEVEDYGERTVSFEMTIYSVIPDTHDFVIFILLTKFYFHCTTTPVY